jgi:hypothetical protein
MTILDSLALKMQNLRHFFGATERTSAATESAAAGPGTREQMPKPDTKVAREADIALGHVMFAIQAFDRDDLLLVAKKLQTSNVITTEKRFSTCSDEVFRKFLSRAARHLRKENPGELIELDRYLVDFSRTQLEQAGD